MDVQAQLIGEEKLKHVQCIKYKNQQTKMFGLQDDYVVNKLNGKELLHAISTIYKPCPHIKTNYYCTLVYIFLILSIDSL